MTITERDAYILDLLTAANANGLTGQQAANEVARVAGVNFIALPAFDGLIPTPQSDRPSVTADIASLQSAAASLPTSPTAILTPIQQRAKNARNKK